MKRLLVIAGWEFLRHLKSRSFILATFISPLIFAGIVLLPSLIVETPNPQQPQVFGCVELDTTSFCERLSQRLQELTEAESKFPAIILVEIHPDTSRRLRSALSNLQEIAHERDSLYDAYNKIKERRKYIFQRPPSQTRERLLRETYEQLRSTREARDMIDLEYNRAKALTDSLLQAELLGKADSLLKNQIIEGYILFNPDSLLQGKVEFHSLIPANFLNIAPLRQALQVLLVEERMKAEGIVTTRIEALLKPVEIQEYLLEGEQRQRFNFTVSYLGPIIVVLFLFISIFTSSGFLFNGIVYEKTNRIIEVLLSSVNSLQLMAGKIFGLGLLGLFQIFIWIALTILLMLGKAFSAEAIPFLTLKNAGFFILYFSLGYLFFAAIFVGIGSLFSSEEDTHHLSQFMRILSILPILLAILVLESPNSLLVRILSFIPVLTPTFMILRIPLGNPPVIDYYISIGILFISIIISILLAARIFRIGVLLYGKKPRLKEIFQYMKE